MLLLIALIFPAYAQPEALELELKLLATTKEGAHGLNLHGICGEPMGFTAGWPMEGSSAAWSSGASRVYPYLIAQPCALERMQRNLAFLEEMGQVKELEVHQLRLPHGRKVPLNLRGDLERKVEQQQPVVTPLGVQFDFLYQGLDPAGKALISVTSQGCRPVLDEAGISCRWSSYRYIYPFSGNDTLGMDGILDLNALRALQKAPDYALDPWLTRACSEFSGATTLALIAQIKRW